MAERADIDWLAVEADYRPNKMSLRSIAEKHNCTEGTIRKRAKKEKWTRDLQEAIKRKADDLVRKDLVRTQVRTEYKALTDAYLVEVNAEHSAAIQIRERTDVARARSLSMALLSELEDQIVHREEYENLGEMLQYAEEFGLDKLIDLYKKVTNFSGRVDNMKKLSDSLKSLIELERKINKLDESQEDEDAAAKVDIDVHFV